MKVHSKLARVRGWLKWFAEKHPQKCVYCGKPVSTDQFLTGDSDDGITLHHFNEDRSDNSHMNLRLYHRSCHQLQHRAVVKRVVLEAVA
jgi:hypothetical protein